MQRKKGISLIVLVITIIVMIILAATIILAINNNNVVDKAKDAVTETNYKQVQELAQTLWADAYVNGARTQEELESAVTEGLKDTDTSKYTITVTTNGVEVSVKTEAPVEPEEPAEPEIPVDPEEPTVPEEPEVVDKSVFANNTWTEIIAAVQNDTVPTTWAVGDTKPMTIGDTEYNIQIIGKDHDTYSDGSGTAPLTFQLVEIYNTLAIINDESTDNTVGWSNSHLRTVTLPHILSTMPSEVQAAIKSVNKTAIKATTGNVETISEKLFLLSEMESVGTSFCGETEDSRYAYYANGGTLIKNLNGTPNDWWTRSCKNSIAIVVSAKGSYGLHGFGLSTNGVSFAFCF